MASSQTPVYLFAGDSLTEGRVGESWVDLVARVLWERQDGLKGRVANAGRTGDTAASLLARIDGILSTMQPQWVILAVGSNDVWYGYLNEGSPGWALWLLYRRLRWGQAPAADLDQFSSTYRAVLDRVRARGIGVLACTVSPLGEDISSPLNGEVARLNGVIKQVAVERGVLVADVWQAFVDELSTVRRPARYVPSGVVPAWWDRRRLQKRSGAEIGGNRRLVLTFDGIHLNRRGAELWALTTLAALARAQSVGQAF